MLTMAKRRFLRLCASLEHGSMCTPTKRCHTNSRPENDPGDNYAYQNLITSTITKNHLHPRPKYKPLYKRDIVEGTPKESTQKDDTEQERVERPPCAHKQQFTMGKDRQICSNNKKPHSSPVHFYAFFLLFCFFFFTLLSTSLM